jgi:Tfp pilus assembly PilM family ATPase
MASLANILEQLRGFDVEHAMGLRPPCPDVALELDRQSMTLVRLKPKRRRRPTLEAYKIQMSNTAGVPATIFDQEMIGAEPLSELLRGLYESAGTRPGRVSLVLPDNLAKISLVTLPERPPSRKQLEEAVRFKMRRSVPFRLRDAALSYQVIPGEGKAVTILVALIRRSLIERYEQALEMIGARPGLIDLCTPSLLNLCRKELAAAASSGDVALLNSARNYFSLVIFRDQRLIFFRCKTYSMRAEPTAEINGLLAREVDYSLSYYEEKLSGEGIGTLLVRSADTAVEEVTRDLSGLDVKQVQPIDPVVAIPFADGQQVDSPTAQRIAPALGAATGRR